MREFALMPDDNHKSFYGKAIVIEHDDDTVELKSYGTIVMRLRYGAVERLWSGYSSTTMRHVNAFLALYGIPGGGKKWWDSLWVTPYY